MVVYAGSHMGLALSNRHNYRPPVVDTFGRHNPAMGGAGVRKRLRVARLCLRLKPGGEDVTWTYGSLGVGSLELDFSPWVL